MGPTEAPAIQRSTDFADFKRSCAVILPVERGYSPTDNNRGAVNWGVTEYLLALIGDQRHPRDLTWEDACRIYEVHYWGQYHLDKLQSQAIADYIFGMIINTDPRRVAIIAQHAAAVGENSLLKCDGIIGPKSLAALNAVDPEVFRYNFYMHMDQWYAAVVASNPGRHERFHTGWINRNKWLYKYSGKAPHLIPEHFDPKFVFDVYPSHPQQVGMVGGVGAMSSKK